MRFKRNSLPDLLFCTLFPRRCKYCGKVIKPKQTVCEDCTVLPEIKKPICYLCGSNEKDCKCKKRAHFYDRIAAPFYYEGAIVTAVRRMKFKPLPMLCRDYAEDMYKFLQDTLFTDREYDCITYIPFSESQKKERKYNYSLMLALELSRLSGIKCERLLSKIYETQPQHLSKDVTRRGNVFGVYDVCGEKEISGKRILLVDDIKTSGATLEECAKILKIYGALRVDCTAFALGRVKQDIDTKG